MKIHLFDHSEYETLTATLPFTQKSRHSRMFTCRGQGPMDPPELAQFQREHPRLLSAFPECFTVDSR